MMLRYAICLIALLFTCLTASAGQVYVGGNSIHMKSAYATNQKHDFLAVEYNKFVVGKFVNSYGDKSKIAGYKYKLDDLSSEHVLVSVVPSVVYGYRTCSGKGAYGPKKYCAGLPLEIQYTKYPIVPTLLITPKAAVLLFSIKF